MSQNLSPDMVQQRIGQQVVRQPVRGNANPTTPPSSSAAGAMGFGSVLQQQMQQQPAQPALTFSGHALQRMQQRQIQLTQAERQSISDAVGKARDKGAQETLILADKGAFVVSVRNNTVITVMDKETLKDNVFTKIDSAIII